MLADRIPTYADEAERDSLDLCAPVPIAEWRACSARRFRALHREISRTPVRLVLGDSAIRPVLEAAHARPSSVLAALSVLTPPWPRVWIEWSGRARVDACRELGIEDSVKTAPGGLDLPVPCSVGCLLWQTAERRFAMRFAWDHRQLPSLGNRDSFVVAPLVVEMQLDRIDEPADLSCAWEKWKDDPVEARASARLSTLAGVLVSAMTADDLIDIGCHRLALGLSEAEIEELWRINLSPECLFVPALLCLLRARNVTVEREHVDRSRLNAKRVRAKKPPLLDHTKIRIRLEDPGDTGPRVGRSFIVEGKRPPRRHVVRAHWVVRTKRTKTGDPVTYFRRAHERGGMHGTVTRIVTVI